MQATKRADPHDLKNIFLKVRFADTETFAGLTFVATLKSKSGVTSAFTTDPSSGVVVPGEVGVLFHALLF